MDDYEKISNNKGLKKYFKIVARISKKSEKDTHDILDATVTGLLVNKWNVHAYNLGFKMFLLDSENKLTDEEEFLFMEWEKKWREDSPDPKSTPTDSQIIEKIIQSREGIDLMEKNEISTEHLKQAYELWNI